MINVCIADNQPVVHFGVVSYFKGHNEIRITHNVKHLDNVIDILKTEQIDVLVIDLELEGLPSINAVKAIMQNFPNTKIIIYTNLSESIYTPNAIKAGVSAYVHKSESLERLEHAIIRVSKGEVIFNEDVKRKLALIAKQNKSERLYRKLSSREVEVLRYLSDGKKNNEIAKILGLNEKTISTYKLRLLAKLHVTNLVDLVNKAKSLEIV
jgi:DNA-binding NarL/FixJ family response regulator